MFCRTIRQPALPQLSLHTFVFFLLLCLAATACANRPSITPLDTKPYDFKNLQQAIGFYQTLNTLPWPTLRKTNKLLRLDDSHPDLAIMRHQLLLLGDLSAPHTDPETTGSNEYFNIHLEQALMHFPATPRH